VGGGEVTLYRVAHLSAQIAERLYLQRNWSAEEIAQHKADVLERESILVQVNPRYGEVLAEAREAGWME
jgi:hypothetical protein